MDHFVYAPSQWEMTLWRRLSLAGFIYKMIPVLGGSRYGNITFPMHFFDRMQKLYRWQFAQKPSCGPPWWRHQMETFSALLAICAGNSPVTGEFPAQRPATQSFDVFFDLRLNKRLSKQSWGWWFETLSQPLWRHRNALKISQQWLQVHQATVWFIAGSDL